jgi:hypothetical protein
MLDYDFCLLIYTKSENECLEANALNGTTAHRGHIWEPILLQSEHFHDGASG